jgi:Domain of unknown function (DUF4352)
MDQQQSPGGSTPQYSPDGNWLWDGAKWVPVAQSAGPSSPAAGARRRRKWPWVVGGLVVVLLVGIVASAANGGGAQQKVASTSTVATQAPATAAPKATAKPATAAPAPAARDGSCSPQPCANDNYGWIVTVSNVRFGAGGGQFDQPEAGNVFVMIDVTFTNKLDQEQQANPTEFVLLDGAGIKHSIRPLVETSCGTWDPVNLTRGATLTKCISFEATAGKPAGLTLVWTPTLLSGDYRIKLS